MTKANKKCFSDPVDFIVAAKVEASGQDVNSAMAMLAGPKAQIDRGGAGGLGALFWAMIVVSR